MKNIHNLKRLCQNAGTTSSLLFAQHAHILTGAVPSVPPLSGRTINRLPSRCIIHDVRVGSLFVSIGAGILFISLSILQAFRIPFAVTLQGNCSSTAKVLQQHCKGSAVVLQKRCSNTAEEVRQYCKVMATWQSNSPPINRLRRHYRKLAVPPQAAVCISAPVAGDVFWGINGCAAPATPLSSPPPYVWPKRSSRRCRPPGGCRRRKDGHSRAPLSAGAPLPDSCPA